MLSFTIIITVVIYISLLVAVLFASKSEYEDLYCPHPGSDVCYYGNGAAYSQGIPNDEDTQEELLEKLQIIGRYDSYSVKWRSCFIFAIIAGFLVAFLVLQRLPNGPELLLAVLTIYLLLYLMTEFYKMQLITPAMSHFDDIVKRIQTQT